MLFVAYELWGTGLTTDSHQNALRQQFDKELRSHHVPTSTKGTTPDTPTVAPLKGEQPTAVQAASGEPVAIIDIPKIGIDYIAVQGTDAPDLERGPGHYVGTALPGNAGNAAFAGHRTTYAAPFYNLNEVTTGDSIYVTTIQGRFQYQVTGPPLVVDPSDSNVLNPTPTPTLTLTTCNPRFSASTRLVVTAALVSPAVAAAPVKHPAQTGSSKSNTANDSLTGSGGGVGAAILWGIGCAVFALAVWLLYRRVRKWWTLPIGAVGLLVLLFFFFGALNPLLPAGY